jgi:beta-lactamase superfamily II metal-dependent hydrolase
VLQRLDHRGVKIFDTATHGAISLKIGPGRGLQRPRLERAASRRIWRAR